MRRLPAVLRTAFRCVTPRRRGAVVPALAIVAAAQLAGCGAGERAASRIEVDTLPGGVVLVRNPEGGLWRPDEAWRAVEVLRIGEVDGAEPYIFGGLREVRLGDDGRVYVLDNQAKQVRIFDAGGRHLRTVGREGAGPGEFRNPTGMAWGPDGNLWVIDVQNQRYTLVTPDGEIAGTHPRAIGGWGWHWDGGFDAEGRLYEPSFFSDPATRESRRVYIRHALREDGPAATDTFDLPRYEVDFYRVTFTGGSMSFGVPFAAGLSWAFDGRGGLWAGISESYRLWHQRLDGDTLRIVELSRDRLPVTPEDRASARERIETRLEGRGGGADQLDFSKIPAQRPAHGPLVVDDDGWVWVAQREPEPAPEGENPPPTTFDVFDPEGRYHGAVTMSVRPSPPPHIAGDRVAGIMHDALGVQRVVVYRLEGREVRAKPPG